MSTAKEWRDYVGLVSDSTTGRIDDLKNILSLMETLFDAKKGLDCDTNLPAKELGSFFTYLLNEIRRIQDEIIVPGEIFSVSEVVNGLKLVKGNHPSVEGNNEK